MAASASVVLREAREALIADSRLVGAALRAQLTEVADAWLRSLLGDVDGVALVAVGGYGRQEPAPGSDLDLLLLHRDGVEVDALAESIWYPIWDAKVGLDHSVRTVPQAVSVARDDLKAALGLLDGRHVAGDPDLSDELHRAAYAAWRRDYRRRLPELVEAVRGRADRSGELAFLLEPDLKESRGGLRDVTAMTSIAAAQVADPPSARVRAAQAWLLDVRGELHRRGHRSDGSRVARGTDRLVKQEHAPVAAALGLADPDELLTRVAEAGRAISFAADESCRRALAAASPPRRWSRPSKPVRRPLADGVVEQDGEVHLARDADPAADPVLVLRVAAAAAQAGLTIPVQVLRRLADDAAPLPQPWPDAARNALVATLGAGRPAIPVMEALDQAGLLVRLMPEWSEVRCKPQHNPVHRFTVDRHLVEAAAEAAAFTRRVTRPDLLLLGALLHDIGKGYPGDHTEAGVAVVPAIGERIGLLPSDVAMLTTLVRHHLLLPDTATRRDLADPATVELVAAAVRDRHTLELLHALTEADAVATGPGAWSEWKAGLVAELVDRTAAVLTGEAYDDAEPLDPEQRALAETGELGVELTGSRLTIVAPDRAGLLWRWAAVLTVHRLLIRSAAAVSVDRPGAATAVTTFEVAPRYGAMPDLDALRTDVRRALADPSSLAAELSRREQMYADEAPPAVPPRVLWIDAASRTASVVEVRAHDVLGLLYRLTRALADADLDVRSARINTLGAEAVDTFYVAGPDGGPITDPGRRGEIEQSLLRACQRIG